MTAGQHIEEAHKIITALADKKDSVVNVLDLLDVTEAFMAREGLASLEMTTEPTTVPGGLSVGATTVAGS